MNSTGNLPCIFPSLILKLASLNRLSTVNFTSLRYIDLQKANINIAPLSIFINFGLLISIGKCDLSWTLFEGAILLIIVVPFNKLVLLSIVSEMLHVSGCVICKRDISFH